MGAGFSIKNPPHPVFADVRNELAARYGARFDGFGLAYYRDARDSVAMHRDREMKWLDDTVVAILTLGAQRPFLVQPKNGSYDRADARDLSPVSGDLMVFGGRFQADWLHGVPKVRHAVRGRISIQMRHTSGRGRPETTPTYYAPASSRESPDDGPAGATASRERRRRLVRRHTLLRLRRCAPSCAGTHRGTTRRPVRCRTPAGDTGRGTGDVARRARRARHVRSAPRRVNRHRPGCSRGRSHPACTCAGTTTADRSARTRGSCRAPTAGS